MTADANARGELHGPYFYRFRGRGGRAAKEYVPLSRVAEVRAACARHREAQADARASRARLWGVIRKLQETFKEFGYEQERCRAPPRGHARRRGEPAKLTLVEFPAPPETLARDAAEEAAGHITLDYRSIGYAEYERGSLLRLFRSEFRNHVKFLVTERGGRLTLEDACRMDGHAHAVFTCSQYTSLEEA